MKVSKSGTFWARGNAMNKLVGFLAKIIVFLLVTGFTFFILVGVIGSLSSINPDASLPTVLVLAAFVIPVILGLWVTRKIHKSEQESNSEQTQEIDTDISDLLNKEESTFAIIKEELSCWNWQLVIGGLIFFWGFCNLFSSFFFAIMLIVFGLGLLSIGTTKYKEKQELQERALKRRILAAAAKASPPDEKPDPAPAPKPATGKQIDPVNTKCKTYKVAGVTHYAKNIESLGIENEDYTKSKRELIAEGMTNERIWKYVFYDNRAELQPEPDNPEDPKAIKVIVDHEHVGYIKSGSCSHVHKLIQNHAIADINCTIGGGPYKYVSEEYDDEEDKNVFVLEKSETNFFVHLEIYEKGNAS